MASRGRFVRRALRKKRRVRSASKDEPVHALVLACASDSLHPFATRYNHAVPTPSVTRRLAMNVERNLLFGVLALQADLINNDQFAQACALWSARKNVPLADLLVEHGWISPDDRADVAKLLERKLKKHQGDARASLAEAATQSVRHTLAAQPDADVSQSLAGLTPPPDEHVLLTSAYVPEARERYTLNRLHATGGLGRVWLA